MEKMLIQNDYQLDFSYKNTTIPKNAILFDYFYSNQDYSNQSKLSVYLTSNYIEIVSKNNSQKGSCVKINLTYKLYILKDQSNTPIGLKIFNEASFYQIYTHDKNTILIWAETLDKYMIRWGFYEDYQPIQKIGKGKSASVFMAYRRRDRTKVAVKAFFKTQLNKQQKSYEALKNQINILRIIKSDYVVKLLAVYQTQKSFYLILQYIEGKQLKQIIEEKNLTLKDIKRIIYMIGLGISDLHSLKIVHRDIKPENIMYDKARQIPVLIDFGLATFSDCKTYIFKHCGTPGFVAPETLLPNLKQVTPIADVFSLGIIFHLLMYKKFPYKGTTCQQILQQNKIAIFKFDRKQHYDTDPQILELIKKMLESKPQNRLAIDKFLQNQFFTYKQQLFQSNSSSSSLHRQKTILKNKINENINEQLYYSKNKLEKDCRMKLLHSGSLDFILSPIRNPLF